jgi:hypothetical protein
LEGSAVRKHKRRLLAALVMLAGAAVFVLWQRPDRVTRANYDRIRMGMSRAEVYAILGPPGDYTTRPGVYRHFHWRQDGRLSYGVGFFWTGDEEVIVLDFNPRDDAVWRMEFEDVGPYGRVELSAFDDLRWRAERQWRRWFP